MHHSVTLEERLIYNDSLLKSQKAFSSSFLYPLPDFSRAREDKADLQFDISNVGVRVRTHLVLSSRGTLFSTLLFAVKMSIASILAA